MGDMSIGMRLVVDVFLPDLLGGSPVVRGAREARRHGSLSREYFQMGIRKIRGQGLALYSKSADDWAEQVSDDVFVTPLKLISVDKVGTSRTSPSAGDRSLTVTKEELFVYRHHCNF